MSDNFRVIDCIAVNNTGGGSGSKGYGFAVQGLDPATNPNDHVNGAQIVGCYAYNNNTDGIDCYHTEGVTVNGCRSERNGLNGFTMDSTSHYGQIIGCISKENAHNGIHLFLSGNVRVEGCLVQSNSYGAAGSYHGIHIESTVGDPSQGYNCLIEGNRILDSQGTKTQEYGIKMTYTDYARIFNNDLDGNRTGAISPVGSNNVIKDNIGYVTENSGTATLANGNTSIAVNHGLAVTPAAGDIMVTPIEAWGNMTNFWIDAYTATRFTIHAAQDPGQDVDFVWKAAVL
jgi:hypothetical protein